MKHKLIFLYGQESGEKVWKQFQKRLEGFARQHPELRDPASIHPLTQADSMLITYGDQVREAHRPPLKSLGEFLTEYLGDWMPYVHLLPFYPYSSDDGFSVMDYWKVDPDLGDWEHIQNLGKSFGLMFDAVINHISRSSEWFQGYLAGASPYDTYFIEVDPSQDLSQVFRPRTHPLLTPVQVGHETRYVWTTFSADQVDLNFANPQVLLEIMDVLLLYVAQGARFLRLDAIAFLWKELGTRCLHLPQTHAVIQLIHAMLDSVAPGTRMITETNVPHEENISYFGDGKNEAHLVYNFALPPLVLHSFRTGDAIKLSAWAASLRLPSKQVTFFNFLASHDGIGVGPVRGILSEAEIDGLVEQTRRHGGRVSARTQSDGSQVPYELNINYFDALSDPASDESLDLQIDRFITAHAILFALVGMPGIYFHSLFGSRSWPAGVAITGQNRTINRQKLARQDLEQELADASLQRAKVFDRLKALLQVRAAHPAFSPSAAQAILDLAPAVFCVVRGQPGERRAVCLHNVSGAHQSLILDLANLGVPAAKDLVSAQVLRGERIAIDLLPYGRLWLDLL